VNRNRKTLLSVAKGMVALAVANTALFGIANGLEAFAPTVEPSQASHPADSRLLVAQATTETAARVTYSSEQADRGEATFEEECVECHGDDLRGGLLGGPPLRGVAFEDKYAHGSPAGVLFEIMSTTMPPNAPGRFSAATYADIMAYILQRNGLPAGGAPLPDNVDALYELVIEK